MSVNLPALKALVVLCSVVHIIIIRIVIRIPISVTMFSKPLFVNRFEQTDINYNDNIVVIKTFVRKRTCLTDINLLPSIQR